MNTCRICWKEIWKTYSDKKLRCSSCRKSVENAIWYNERTVEYVEDELYAWKSEYKKLKKENIKLNENIAWYEKEEDRLRKENRKLKEENDRLKNNAMEDMRVQTKLEEKISFLSNRIKELEECNLNLQEWLDNKEKVNKQLREEIQQRINAVNNM